MEVALMKMAQVGTRAPDFDLPCTNLPNSKRGQVTLADYEYSWLLLILYAGVFPMLWRRELTAVSGRLAEFTERDCKVLGISTDSLDSHDLWVATPRTQGGLGGLSFPLASDERGEICEAYGVFIPRRHLALRGLFIIDPNGVVQYQLTHNLNVGRSTEEVLRVLDALQTGGLCPGEWTAGQENLDPVRTLGPDSLLGPYRIESILGTGSFGTVFRA